VVLGDGVDGAVLVLSDEGVLLELSFVAVPLVPEDEGPADVDDDVLRLSFL
jgi:hypothetical protein